MDETAALLLFFCYAFAASLLTQMTYAIDEEGTRHSAAVALTIGVLWPVSVLWIAGIIVMKQLRRRGDG